MSKNDVLERQNIVLNTALDQPEGEISQDVELKSLAEVEKAHIKAVLDSVHWNKVDASRILEITRPTLNAKIEKYNLKQ
jgi:two-component system response regulator AtoC